MLKFNLKMSCEEYYNYLMDNPNILKEIGSSEKYK